LQRHGKPNGARKAGAPNDATGKPNGKSFSTNTKRIEAEAALCRHYIAAGMKPIDAVRKLARCIAPDPWQRKPGSQ
jgi:hypothetical protein